jgi:hypothetical protein
MAHAAGMPANQANLIPVIDFRRHRMVLQWHAAEGTWSAFDTPPALVHGIALIRAAPPNICLYASDGRLRLQIGSNQYALSDHSPRIRCTRATASFGLRRRFTVDSSSGGVLYSHAYWTGQGPDFFLWLAARAEDPEWRSQRARVWTEGLAAAVLRSD